MSMKIGFYSSNGIHNLSPKEAFELSKHGAVILDIREDYMNLYKRFGVKNELQISNSRLSLELSKIPNDKTVIVADAASIYSRDACLLLLQNGFKDVKNLAGGIVEWERDGMPIIFDNKEKLSGSCMCMLRNREKK